MDVTYIRYQDDILILCPTKRSLYRCKRRMMNVLQERRLSLSRKKTCIGSIEKGFHFLGIHYPGTRPLDNTNMTQVDFAHNSNSLGGEAVSAIGEHSPALTQIVPHARTLRKAREQVQQMVKSGVSPRRIASYLNRWTLWWVSTSEKWHYIELLKCYLAVCWDGACASIAYGLIYKYKLKDGMAFDSAPAALTAV